MNINFPVIPTSPINLKDKFRLLFVQQQCLCDTADDRGGQETKTYLKVLDNKIYVTKIEHSCPHGYWD